MPGADPELVGQQHALVLALQQSLGGGGQPVQLYETHISWVLVAGPHAYKIKKAVHYDFLDFRTLASRFHSCIEEVRLNRRLAPDLYLDVQPVSGSAAAPFLGGAGEPVEYAVRMRSFPQDARWDERLRHGTLAPREVDALASLLARFHRHAAVAPPGLPHAGPADVRRLSEDNMRALRTVAAGACGAAVRRLGTWLDGALDALAPLFAERKQAGAVRECHGDLHCGNILTLDGQVLAFDCIEFSEALRWLDVMHDLAFACMDLRQRGAAPLAARLLNAYLERGGDYGGLRVLCFYMADAALVRAKVELVRASQLQGEGGDSHARSAAALLALAERAAAPRPRAVFIMHGVCGSGKSSVARQLVEWFDAVQLRSDVERKRLHGLDPFQPGGGVPGLYGPGATARVYARLDELARLVAGAGFSPVLDACNLRRAERDAFVALAGALGLPAVIVSVGASEPVMRERLRARKEQGRDPSDADEAVLDFQLRVREALAPDELERTVIVDSESAEVDQLHLSLEQTLSRISSR